MLRASEFFAGRRIVVCCGAGGVGKTTLAAAMALEGARGGRDVLVCTIDPARRLAQALGIAECPVRGAQWDMRVPLPAGNGRGAAGGSLRATMLDVKSAFDRVVMRYAPSEQSARAILANGLYQGISQQLAGTSEYMAMERVHELYCEGNDLIVLDTPPSTHALDFLEAPRRLGDFLDSRFLRWFSGPQAAGLLAASVARRGKRVVSSALRRLFGEEVITAVAEFLGGFEGMYEGFRSRAQEVARLLGSPQTAFVLVTTPQRGSAGEVRQFASDLERLGIRLEAALVNQSWKGMLPDGQLARPKRKGPGSIHRRIHEAYGVLSELAAADAAATTLVAGAVGDSLPIVEVPRLGEGVFDLAGLAQLNRWIWR